MEPRWPVGLPTRLRPVELIGSGTSAVVWKARDRRHGRDVAVKVLAASDPRRSELLRVRLEHEARALARLRGVAGVVAVLELGLTLDGVGWLVTELVDAGSLADRGPASVGPEELQPMAAALAAGLARAHAHGVVHGDISPGNLLVDAGGGALLADFGMAVLEDGQRTPGGFTPAFAAPERLAGEPPSEAADVYSLAASIAWVSEGDPPAAEVLRAALGSEPRARPDASDLAGALAAARLPGSTSRPGRRAR